MNRIPVALVFFSTLLFYSCAKDTDCAGLCQPVYPEVVFKIVNSAGKNLVSGPDKVYTSNKIAIKILQGGILVDEVFGGFSGDSTLAATPLFFNASNLGSQYYLYINNVKTDSLQVVYRDVAPNDDCCPSYSSISSLKLNNVTTTYIYPNPPAPLNIVK